MLNGLELGPDGVMLVLAERIGTVPGDTGGGGSGGHIIADEGSAFPQRATLNFMGGVVVSDNQGSNRTNVLIDTTTLGAVPTSALGTTVATLVDGVVPSSQLPALAINDVFTVNSEAEMLALAATVGDVAIRTDTEESFILTAGDPSVLGNWTLLFLAGGDVSSVNGQTGVVVLGASDIGAVDLGAVGAPGGVAALDGAGDVPDGQIPNNIARLSQVPGLDIPVLTTVASGTLTAEVVVGLTPGGELGGTWDAPTVDATHSGSSHADVLSDATDAATNLIGDHVAATANAHLGQAVTIDPTNLGAVLTTGVVNVQLLAEEVNLLTAANMPVDTSGFSQNLGVSDSTVQAALNTLDLLHFDFSESVSSVNTFTGDVVLTATDVGAIDFVLLGVPNGVATLDGTGRLSFAQWPDVVFSVNGLGGTVVLNGGSIPLDDSGWTTNLLGVNPDVQSVADAVDTLASSSGTFAGFVAPPLTEFDGAAADPTVLNTPAIFVSSHVTLTDSPVDIEQGTPLLIHFDQDLKYTELGGLGPNYAVAYRPTAWDVVNYSQSHYPRGVITAEGISTFYKPAGLLATELTFIDLRATQNAPKRAPRSVTGGATVSGSPDITGNTFSSLDLGDTISGTGIPALATIIAVTDSTHATISANATSSGSGRTFTVTDPTPAISNAHAFLNNHTYLADTDAVDWALPVSFANGPETIVAMLNCYPGGGFIDQPLFTPHHVNGGTLSNASHVSFLSAPLIYSGVHMNQRWGYYYEDTLDTTIGIGDFNWLDLAANGGGTLDRQVAIQIGVLRSGADYNIPFNYGDANVANAPLFRVGADGFVTTGAVLGLGNILGLTPAASSAGVIVADARGTLLGPISGFTHTTAAVGYQMVKIANTANVVMNASSGNAYTGLVQQGTISFAQTGSVLGSAMFSGVNTFTASSGVGMGTLYGAYMSPSIIGVGTSSVTSIGYAAAPTLTHTGTGALTATVTTLLSAPTINDANVTATRTAIDIQDINGSNGTINSNIGLNIAALSRGGANAHGIVNLSDSILSGGIFGSTTASGNLTIGSTTNAAKGTITLSDATALSSSLNVSGDSTLNKLIVQSTTTFADSVEMRPADATLTSEPTWYVVNNAFMLNFASAAGGIYQDFSPTLINAQSANVLRNVVGYNFNPTVKNSGATNFGPITGFISTPTVNVDTNTGRTLSILTEFYAGAAWTTTSTGALATTNWYQYRAAGTAIASGHTITTRTALLIEDPTGAGVLTNNLGIDIAAQTKGATLNIGLRNAAQTQLLTTTLIGGSTAPANQETVVVQGSASTGATELRYMSIKPTLTSLSGATTLTALYLSPTLDADFATTAQVGLNVSPAFTGDSTATTATAVIGTATQTGNHTVSTLIGGQFTAQTADANSTATLAVALDLVAQKALGLGTMTTSVLLRGLTNGGATAWNFQFGDFQSYHIGKMTLGASTAPVYALDLRGTAQDRGVIALAETASTPTNPSQSDRLIMYFKGDTLVFGFNDAGTMRYLSIAMTGTGTTWTHGTAAP